MIIIDFLMDWIVPFLFILTVLVFVHELGHYWVARRCGVRVEVFSIGFGPELFGKTDRHGTRWKFSALPLGGYVKMFGEHAESEEKSPLSPAERKVAFTHKSVGRRAAIVAAGPVANYLLAIVLFAGMFAIIGNPRLLAVVGSVVEDSAAAEAGFQPGDRIIRVAGEPIEWFDDLRSIVAVNPGVAVEVRLVRGNEEVMLTATPRPAPPGEGEAGAAGRGQLGVIADSAQLGYVRDDPLTASWRAVQMSYDLTVRILAYVGQVVVGQRSAEDIGGPIRIAHMAGEMADQGFRELFYLMAVLSVNLGLINLFPIPMLDGGHLVFYAAEAIRGRPLAARIQEYGLRFGLLLVFLIMILVIWNDVVNLPVFENI